jgi:ribosomal protein L9
MKRKGLGEILRDEGLISAEQLQAALEKQKTEKGLRIGEVLVAMGAVTAEQVAQAIWQQRQRLPKPSGNSGKFPT